MNLIEGQGLPDFVMLDADKVSEDGFMENLKLRFDKKQIYTYIGEQLVSLNPFQAMPHLYDEKFQKAYQDKYLYEVQPHIYALADDTFRAMMQSKADQCVIITGESGAGKTEASKIFMQYISRVSSGGVKGEAEIIKQKLLDSNPVLEAFGNAKTVRNDNSSRFGKYMEIQFDGAGAPLGGKISQYLLEKSRVVTRTVGERTFHVFYMFLKQADLCTKYELKGNPEDYEYLALSECYEIAHQNDKTEWTIMVKAMDTLGFTSDDKDAVWRVLAAILHMGNVTFKEAKKGATDGSELENPELVRIVAKLLHVEFEALERVLVSRTITSGATRRSSAITVFLTVKQAQNARDSFSKALYNAVFTLVTKKLNKSIDVGDKKCEVVIGVLDIYGFEIFNNNSFEQFCINYCNEKLQQIFIKLVLKAEQEEYVREGIEWKEIDYFNNAPIVELIEGKTGIFKKLDEACLIGEVTPKQLLEKFDHDFSINPYYDSYHKSKGKIPSENFQVKHYAGVVDYEILEFADKNRDTLYLGLKKLLQSSNDVLVKNFFPVSDDIAAEKKRPTTAGTQFVQDVNALINTLTQCQPHYIRCIKSNDKKQSFGLNEERVRHQVRYLNLVETLRVRRAGFCNRQHYSHFMRRYKMLTPRVWPSWQGDDVTGTQAILDDIHCDPDEYRKGRTKLFVRNAKTLFKFEKLRADEMPKVAVAVQRRWRAYNDRVDYLKLKVATDVQRLWKGFKARRLLKRMKAVVAIQRRWQAFLARETLAKMRVAQTIQRLWRGYKARKLLKELKNTLTLQRNFRGYKGRRFAANYKLRMLRKENSAIIQKHLRGYLARKHYAADKERLRKEREEAIRKAKEVLGQRIQALWRYRQSRLATIRLAAMTRIQAWVRGFLARRQVRRLKAIVNVETSWRQRNARVFYFRLKAAVEIQRYLRYYAKRRYVNRLLVDTGGQHMKDEKDNFGKDIKLSHYQPAPLEKTHAIMSKIKRFWWAHNKVASLSKDDNVLMRQKVITLDLFRGKKTWDPERLFTGDYMDVKTNTAQDKYKETIRVLFQHGGDNHISFADAVIKVNRKGASQIQVVVVTNANIYKYTPGNYKMIKTGAPINAVKGIHLSNTKDSFIIIEMESPHRDYVLDLGTNGAERYSELATIIFKARYDQGKTIPVTFGDSITFNNSRTAKEEGQKVVLKFEKNQKPDPKHPCKFTGPKNGTAAVLYNE